MISKPDSGSAHNQKLGLSRLRILRLGLAKEAKPAMPTANVKFSTDLIYPQSIYKMSNQLVKL